MRAIQTILFVMLVLYGSLALGEDTASPTHKTLPPIPPELLELYERAMKAGEKIQIPDEMFERAKAEIKRIDTWEYRVMTLHAPQDATLEQQLNNLGKERWECHVTPRGQANVRLVCQRPVRSYLKNIAITDLLRLIP